MLELLTNHKDWLRVIKALPKDILWASSFNLSTWKRNGIVEQILTEFNKRNSNLIVGVPIYRPCFNPCKQCHQRHKKSLLTLARLKNTYSNINWYFVGNLHAKFIVSGKINIIGGRNITDSTIDDIVIVNDDVKMSKKLIKYANSIIFNAYDIGSDGPVVDSIPYKGELLANSTSISKEYKAEFCKLHPESILSKYWLNE